MASAVTRDHHLWTRDTIKNLSGDVTLDIAGDITLDTGGQQLYIESAGNDFVKFDYTDGAMFIYGGVGAGTGDYLKFNCTTSIYSKN